MSWNNFLLESRSLFLKIISATEVKMSINTFLNFLFFCLILHGQMNTRGLISYLWRPLIGLGRKLVHLPLSGSHSPFLENKPIERLQKNEINPRVFIWPWSTKHKNKKLRKVLKTREKRGKTGKREKIKEKSNQLVKEMSENDGSKA